MTRKIFFLLAALIPLASIAQKNVFLDRAFWKAKPDVAAIQSEISKGSDATQLNENAFDATVYAILEKAPQPSIDFLLSQKGNDVNKITHDGRTYLFWAAYAGNTHLVKQLLDSGAKTTILDDHGYTALTFAAATGQQNTEVFDILLQRGFKVTDVDHDGANALLLAAPTSSDFKVIDYFSKKGLNIESLDANGNSAFNYAARTGNVAYLGSLIKKGVPYNNNAFLMAAAGTRGTSNKIDVYKFLKSLDLDPAAKGKNGENALHSLARKDGQLEIIQWFLDNGADAKLADKDGNTPLMSASGSGEIAVIKLFSEKASDINQTNKKGMSALTYAVRSNSPDAVQFLIGKGAKTDLSDANGDNLSAYLIQSYSPKKADQFEAKLKFLEAGGFKINAAQPNGNTLYHLAIAKNDLDLVKKVASYQTDVNAANKEGMTPLHKAAMTCSDDQLMKYLISIGAKKQAKTEMDETAYDLASENELLKKKGINIQFLKS